MKNYDVIVIGAGVGGLSAAAELHAAGKKVAVVEADRWGGTCPNRGCDPKKILVAAVEAQERVKQLQGKGFTEIPAIDWPQLQAFKRTFTDPYSANRRQGVKDSGIDVYDGEAAFIDAHQIKVGSARLSAHQLVIATGQQPSLLPIKGQELLKTSTDFLSLDRLPERITFLGAGYIAFELANIANSCGAEVTIIHHNRRALKAFDEELVALLVSQMEGNGIKFIWDANVTEVRQETSLAVMAGTDILTETDLVICATGRKPDFSGLALANAGVKADAHGIMVNEQLQTNIPHIYACGDVLAKKRPKLTPVAVYEGEKLAKIMLGQEQAITYPVIPTIVYGTPKLAKVGDLSGEGVTTTTLDLTGWYTYRRVNEPLAKIKLAKDPQGHLVGATVLSGQADELIDFLTIMIQQGIHHEEVAAMIMGYPTIASDLEFLV